MGPQCQSGGSQHSSQEQLHRGCIYLHDLKSQEGKSNNSPMQITYLCCLPDFFSTHYFWTCFGFKCDRQIIKETNEKSINQKDVKMPSNKSFKYKAVQDKQKLSRTMFRRKKKKQGINECTYLICNNKQSDK